MKSAQRLLITVMILCLLMTTASFFTVSAGAAGETHTITFDVQGIGETPAPITVNDGEKYLYMRENDHGQNPTADGYVFHCWVTTLDYEPDEIEMSNTAAYLETPIYDDITLYALWYKIVDKVDVTADPPVAGDAIGTKRYETEDYSFDYPYPRPNAAVTSEGARVQPYSWDMSEKSAVWLSDPDDRESTFEGTFEDGKKYGVWVMIEPLFGYEFADQITITMNGESLGEKPADDILCIFTAPIWCGEKPIESETKPAAVVPTSGKVVPTGSSSKDQATKDQTAAKNTSNPNAVQTGDGRGYLILALPVVIIFTVFLLRRKRRSAE